MSVRYQRRLYIEELFSHLKQNAREYRIYNLYVPESGDIEAISFPQRKSFLITLKNR
ncbi:MAG: hypothetical protein JHC21_02425 [Thermocrinis sp.]|nr:hypothetical protein [Thermocrinis sp.]